MPSACVYNLVSMSMKKLISKTLTILGAAFSDFQSIKLLSIYRNDDKITLYRKSKVTIRRQFNEISSDFVNNFDICEENVFFLMWRH